MYIITSIVLKNFTDSHIYRFCDLLLLSTEPRSGDTLLYNFKLRISEDLRLQARLIFVINHKQNRLQFIVIYLKRADDVLYCVYLLNVGVKNLLS